MLQGSSSRCSGTVQGEPGRSFRGLREVVTGRVIGGRQWVTSLNIYRARQRAEDRRWAMIQKTCRAATGVCPRCKGVLHWLDRQRTINKARIDIARGIHPGNYRFMGSSVPTSAIGRDRESVFSTPKAGCPQWSH
jgi:hypothetical protein